MSATAQHLIQQAVVDALKAAPALAEGRVFANRVRTVSAASATAVAVRLERSTGAAPTLHATDWRTSLLVECYARGVANNDPAAAVDALLYAVWQRLGALQAASLGLIDLRLEPDMGWDYDDAETPAVCVTLRLTAEHRTATDSLTPWN